MTVRATYRLQFTPDFGFDRAADLVPYLARLGVSHLYASPYLKARPGSTHGYDIVDHTALNPELGDVSAFDRMSAALASHGLGQILDFVPNHMGVGGSDNPFWLDVLEWGPDAEHAGWFDIEWTPERLYLHDKLLIPFLGRQYGSELENGQLTLRFNTETGGFAVWAYDTHKLPISPFHYGRILGTAERNLARIGDAFANLADWRPQVARRADGLKAELATLVRDEPTVAVALARAVARYTGQTGDASSWAALDALIQDQHWRPAYFKVAADDINYRRFFNIAELAGIRMELPSVFDHAHRLVFNLMGRGIVDGLRIDHIDGLLDPKGYLEQLRAKAPPGPGGLPFYLVVEKILAEDEHLRQDWPVEGTTGYEATNLLLGVLIDPAGEVGFTRLYDEIAEDRRGFDKILRESKKRIMDNEMASELAVLAREAARIAQHNNKTADFTRNILRRAIREIVACFPLYRTYVDFSGVATDDDRRSIDEAIALARPNEAAVDASVFEFLRQVLTGDLVAEPNSGFSRSAVLRCALKLQQYSGPVMAKGLEDTAFYRYNRFIALNEVGGHPQGFGTRLATFDAANRERAERWPGSMLATSTHDTKRGEDARARLAVLSELPDEWAQNMRAWMAVLEPSVTEAGPDRNDIYALLQTFIGTWPVELLGENRSEAGLAAYAERVKGAMTKFMREAKVHSTWAAPDELYEAAFLALVDAAIRGERAEAFLPSFLPFANRIAQLGVENSLIQTTLKLTLPGVPDIYQGAELWDLSMVDPDNRRPVDYPQRLAMLEEVEALLTADGAAAMGGFFADWTDGRVKLALIHTLLHLRGRVPELFAAGDYRPLVVEGAGADAICAYERRLGSRSLCVALARFPARGAARTEGTQLRLPEALSGRTFSEVVSGRTVQGSATLAARDLFAILPVAVLMAE